MPASFPLPVNVDSSYADSGTDATVALHQQHHDLIHDTLNNGHCLAWLRYGPGTNVDIGTTGSAGSAPTAVDATNLSITFIVPASGKVKVSVAGRVYTNAAASSIGWCLLDTSNAVIANTRSYMSGAQAQNSTVYTMTVTGLTPGASVTYRLGHYNAGGSGGTTTAGDTGAFGSYGPIHMEVWAMP